MKCPKCGKIMNFESTSKVEIGFEHLDGIEDYSGDPILIWESHTREKTGINTCDACEVLVLTPLEFK